MTSAHEPHWTPEDERALNNELPARESNQHSEFDVQLLQDSIDMEVYDVVAGETYRNLVEQLETADAFAQVADAYCWDQKTTTHDDLMNARAKWQSEVGRARLRATSSPASEPVYSQDIDNSTNPAGEPTITPAKEPS